MSRSGRWTPRRAWSRAREVAREQGLRSVGFKLLGETIYRRALVCERLLDAMPPRFAPADELLRSDQIESYLELRPDADAGEIRTRLEAGELCFVDRDGDRLACAIWMATGSVRIDYLDRKVELAADEAYAYDAYTAPWARGGARSVAVADALAGHAAALGLRRLVAIVMPENAHGRALIPRWGYRPIGVARAVRLGRWWPCAGRLPGGAAAEVGGAGWNRALRRVEDRPHYLDPFLGRVKRERHLRLAREWGELRRDGRVLKTDLFEEAAGPDAFLADLEEEARSLVGMDVSMAVVERARRRAPAPLQCAVADARRLPYADGSFATVISTSTLDHFPDPSDLGVSLRELLRVLEPGGRLVITLDNRQNLFDPLLRLVRRCGGLPYYVGRSYRIGELEAELEAAGFEVAATTAILHNPRLMAVGLVRAARWTHLGFVARAVERLLLAAQRLEASRWRYYSGSFVAALGRRPRRPVSAA